MQIKTPAKLCLLLILGFLLLLPHTSLANPLENWHWRNPLPQGNPLSSIAYGDGLFVAVGFYGTVLTSPDGVTWNMGNSGTGYYLSGVVYGNGLFVAVSYYGYNATIITSPDGTTWNSKTFPGKELYGVTYGNGLFIAVGRSGAVLSSPDGETWTTENSGTSRDLQAITFGNSIFVAVGERGTILTSPDGETWTPKISGTLNGLSGAAHGATGFAVVGSSGTILTSPDGETWIPRTSGVSKSLTEIVFGYDTFVAVGIGGTVLTSPDGETWMPMSSGTNSHLYGITYSGASYIAVGWDGTIVTSPDAETWTRSSSGSTNSLYEIIYNNQIFVTVGHSGTILTSPDGQTWTEQDSKTSIPLESVTYGNGIFVAVGNEGIVRTSEDAETWTEGSSGTSKAFLGVTYGNGLFVAVGESGTILTSPDGQTWTPRTSGTSNILVTVCFAHGIFVTVGDGGTILTSPDGSAWTSRTSGTSMTLAGIAYGNGTFVALEFQGYSAFTSPDGVIWAKRIIPGYPNLQRLTYGLETFVAAGGGGMIFTSPDGVAWTRRKSVTSNNLSSVASGNDTFVLVGDGGTVLQSDPVTLVVNPAAADFGNADVGTISTPQTFTITNPSKEDVVISSVELTGTDPGDFTLQSDSCTGQTLPSLESCTVEVSFSPNSLGPKTALLRVTGSDPVALELDVPLTGTGGIMDISVIPTTIDFGRVRIGTSSDQSITVRNDGTADLRLTTIQNVPYPFSKTGGTCTNGTVLAPGATCSINLRFTPFLSGPFNGSFGILSNDPDESQVRIDLTGTGIQPYTLTVLKNGTGSGTVTASGIDCGDDCTETYDSGTMVLLTAVADPNSVFSGWSGNGCSGTDQCSITMSTNMTVTATFTAYSKVTLLAPNGSEVIPSGSPYEVEWGAPQEAATFSLFYSLDGGVTWVVIGKNITETSTTWHTPILKKNNTKVLLKIIAFGDSGNRVGSDKSDGPFTVEVLTITDPISSDTCTSGQPCLISWDRSAYIDAHTGKLSYSTNGGLTWKLIADKITESDTSYSSWIPTVGAIKKNCKVKLVYKNDKGATVGTATSGKFTINTR